MMKLSQTLKIAAARAGFLACFGVIISLAASDTATARPTKYRDSQVTPVLVLMAADDFRAPPPARLVQTANTSAATTDDFRAPPADLIQTGSTNKIKNCSRVTHVSCDPHH